MLDLLYRRRSIRRYKDTPVSQQHRDQLIQAGLLAPSSRGRQPWEFLLVDEREKLERMARAKPGANFLKTTPLAIVVLGDPEKSDVWIEDTSIAMTQMWLTAESLGLGACWIQIRHRQYSESESSGDYVRGILGIPENRHVEAILACGYPDETKAARRKEDLLVDRVFINAYGRKA